MVDEQAQSHFVHPVALGEGERFAHEVAPSLAQGVVPTLDMAGFALLLARAAVRAPGKDFVVGQPEVAARGAAAGSRAGCVRAGRGHCQQNDPRRSKRPPGEFGGRGRPTPSAGLPWSQQSSKARRVRARRPFGQEGVSHSAAAGLRLFFEPLGHGLSRHAKDTLGRPQAQALELYRSQDRGLALQVDGWTSGHQHPVRPARLAEVLLGARTVVARFDDGRAGARRTARSRSFHARSS